MNIVAYILVLHILYVIPHVTLNISVNIKQLNRLLIFGALIGTMHALILGSLFVEKKLQHIELRKFWDENPKCEGLSNKCEGEPRITIGFMSFAFFGVLGWIPATAYIAMWNLLWKRKNKKQIKQLGEKYKGRWFEYIINFFFIICGAYFLLICFGLIYEMIFNFDNLAIIKNQKYGILVIFSFIFTMIIFTVLSSIFRF